MFDWRRLTSAVARLRLIHAKPAPIWAEPHMSLPKNGILHLALFCLAIVPTALVAQAEYHPDELALKPKIDAAIDRGVEYLLEQQYRDGSWGLHAHLGGRAGLALYTLLQCGVSRDHPGVRRALG